MNQRPEIDQYTIKFLIGLLALLLPSIELVLTKGQVSSISASFWYGDGLLPRSVLVGSLFAVSALLAGYNGSDKHELWFAKAACVSTVLMALLPCEQFAGERGPRPVLHLVFAVTLYVVLAWFCKHFMDHAKARVVAKQQLKQDGKTLAKRRIVIYRVCMIGMLGAIALICLHSAAKVEKWVLWGETLGLYFFALSWLTASKAVPGIKHLTADPDERRELFPLAPAVGPHPRVDEGLR